LLPYEKEKVYFFDCWGQLKITKQSIFVRYLHHKYSQYFSFIFSKLFAIDNLDKYNDYIISHYIQYDSIVNYNTYLHENLTYLSNLYYKNIAYDYFFDNIIVKASSIMALKTKVNLFNTFNFSI